VPIELLKIPKPIRYSEGLEVQRAQGAPLELGTERIAKLILLQHTPVFTLGRKTGRDHLLCSAQELAARTGAEVLETDRGGSVTFHAPGQLTAYLLLNLRVWNLTIHKHLDNLEQVAIQTLARFGIAGRREPRMTGVWVAKSGDTIPNSRELGSCPPISSEKICAIGVSARRWVSYHGLSLNVDLDLGPFFEVVPCGLAGKGVTSMARVLGRPVSMPAVEEAIHAAFGEVYGPY